MHFGLSVTNLTNGFVDSRYIDRYIYVVVNFLSQVTFIFPLFLAMVMYANEFETKEN